MGVLESILFLVGRWFGYVGTCVIAPDATCRPFLAFVALCAAASAALTLVFLAYRAGGRRTAAELNARAATARRLDAPERMSRIMPDAQALPKPALRTLHAA